MTGETETWRPFGMDEAQHAVAYDVLVEGVPAWMTASVFEWIKSRLTVQQQAGRTNSSRSTTYSVNFELVRRAERVLRLALGWQGGRLDISGAATALWKASGAGANQLAVVDFLLSETTKDVTAWPAQYMETILSEGGSAYRVGMRAGKVGLLRRVPMGVQAAADQIMQSGTRAGEQLAEAWVKVFGLSPDPSGGYRMAVKAVETAAIAVVSPNHADATLGSVVGQMKADGDWRLPFLREHDAVPTNGLLLDMLQTLWRGQHDRHGGESDLPPEVTQAEAEAAVAMSVSLVQWFASGAVARRP